MVHLGSRFTGSFRPKAIGSQSTFGGFEWKFDASTRAWYTDMVPREAHRLNVPQPRVVEQMNDVIRFWLADSPAAYGFRIDVIAGSSRMRSCATIQFAARDPDIQSHREGTRGIAYSPIVPSRVMTSSADVAASAKSYGGGDLTIESLVGETLAARAGRLADFSARPHELQARY